jgi:2-isopropylmalate synthase
MALKTRESFFGLSTGVQTTRLYPTSRIVSQITGMPVPRNKAIVGENAFAHESGIHQHGMLRHHSTYEIMRPQDVGLSRTSLVLGKHSGRHALRERVKELGFEVDEAEFARVFEEFKALADKKKELFDGDIEALVMRAESGAPGPWLLEAVEVTTRRKSAAVALVRLKHTDGRALEERTTGDGPVDAAIKAIEHITGVAVQVRKFELHSLSGGEDAQGEAVITVEHNGRGYRGTSVSTDIVEAAAHAFLEVVNRIESTRLSGERRTLEQSVASVI